MPPNLGAVNLTSVPWGGRLVDASLVSSTIRRRLEATEVLADLEDPKWPRQGDQIRIGF